MGCRDQVRGKPWSSKSSSENVHTVSREALYDAALLRSFRDGGPALDRPNHSPTQILRIRLRHSCRPPPGRHLESCTRRYGNPRVSLLGKRSKVTIYAEFTNLPIRHPQSSLIIPAA